MNRRDFLKSALAVALTGVFIRPASFSNNANAKDKLPIKGSQVTRRKVSNSQTTVPLLGFGMMRLPRSGSEINEALAQKMIDRAMQAGVNYFDTAYPYHGGKSEIFAGKALKKYPRDSFLLANKLPTWLIRSPKDTERIFNEQLNKCQVEYFDFYLIHALNKDLWSLAKNHKVYDFLLQKKEEGKIKHLGFSFHDSPEVLQDIASSHKWDFAMIQLNYLDWDLYRSREQYEILTKFKIPVWVMEPLRGGALATLNQTATDILNAARPDASNASWGLRFAASLPNVACVLSGMTHPDHLTDNIKTMTPFNPLTKKEKSTLNRALIAYKMSGTVPCTGCRYCLPCPAGVDIPRIFGLYNQYKISGNKWLFGKGISALPEGSGPESCIDCGLCLTKCPQKINIPSKLKEIR